ncbi:Efflux pump antibiotic resistance protein [Rasamsonia emersonii CBS 393.64]|uniref:Efflux pump antibiotic resistance protein n=1 Tax=Rasamsonia emersonii (strain ATCC 16479 / CBS 393.64 / IMI 116815) TaxID=1408163 RepID=A0A0F4YLN9_RASE3|nr:Efflux pump antibiotic resistance protein [Rasamsonia emersonii CBS 393.64]KKA19040.1 Efflux pump antibiotic resistance protein [Rasamsonia emersonii CBS 393.64]
MTDRETVLAEKPREESPDQKGEDVFSETNNSYLMGWRLYLTTIGLLFCIYLVNLETTIVSTSLVTITNNLHGFDRTSWVVTGYLITSTGMLLVTKKNGVIICRAFQGIGAAGAYSVSILIFYEMLPKSKLPLYGVFVSSSITLGFSTGPLLGGALDDYSNWRWVFYINLPIGGVAIFLLMIALPVSFGSNTTKQQQQHRLSRTNLLQIDLVGAVLLLASSLPLITVPNEVNVRFRWSDRATIALLVISGIAWIAFLVWEHFITAAERRPAPIFPTRFLVHRPWMGMLLTTFLVGFPSNVVVVSLPQRFQVVTETSALSAGVRLLAYSCMSAVAVGVANIASKKGQIPFIYFLILGSILHTIGVALLSTLPKNNNYFPAAGYVYEILAGAGVGTTFGILLLATPFVVEPKDLAVATGAIIQFRFLGGAIGLGIASNVLNGMLKSRLHDVLSPEQLQTLLQNTAIIRTLGVEQQKTIQSVFAQSYNVQFRIMIGFAAAQLPAAALLWRRGATQLTAVEN